MANIFFSMSGEGRGHATRMGALVGLLRDRHRAFVRAPGDAFDLLAPTFAGTEVCVERIPGLRFEYNEAGRLKYTRTIGKGLEYLAGLPGLVRRMAADMRGHEADVVITDFEMSLPRAAKRLGIPFISFNHQHFLVVNDLSSLPGHLRRHAAYMGAVVRSYYRGQALTVVSSFYFPPLKERYRDNVVQVGVILRPAVLAAKPTQAGHLVAYLRRFAPDNVVSALKSCGMPVKVYGLGEREADGALSFHPVREDTFVADLASCEALVCTAGNQLVGEALHFGKPVLAMPEAKNFEQYINAHFLASEGTGEWVELDRLDSAALGSFLGRLDEFRARIEPGRYNGNPRALQAVEQFIESIPSRARHARGDEAIA